jgi:hypothetical protein
LITSAFASKNVFLRLRRRAGFFFAPSQPEASARREHADWSIPRAILQDEGGGQKDAHNSKHHRLSINKFHLQVPADYFRKA